MDNGLSYFIPHHGRAKISLRVPESHRLNVCPAACGRRVGLRALKNGEAGRQSFLYITEADVISGDYENMIGDAVAELLEVLSPVPRAFLIYVNCIDDFLGTDEEALLDRLRRRFPAQRFAVCHIDPIAAQEGVAPGARMQDRLYALLDHADPESAVNLMGNFVSPDPRGELFPVLRAMGVTAVRELHALRTYDEFQRMGGARLNLVLMGMGRYAAQNLERRLGIPWLDVPVSYDLAQVARDYAAMAAVLGSPVPKLEPWRSLAEQAVSRCLAKVGNTPLVVDSSAAMRPFALAKALLEYGFRVEAVFLTHAKEEDLAQRAWLEEHCPDTRIIQAGRYGTAEAALPGGSIAVGFDAAFTMRAAHFVDLQRDETLFGFHGIQTLMGLIEQAADTETRWD